MVLQNTGTAAHRYCRAQVLLSMVLQSIGTAEHRSCRTQVLQEHGTAEHGYCRARVLQNTGTAEHKYCRAQVLQSTGTVEHRYSKLHVLQSTGTVEHRYSKLHVLQSTGTVEHRYSKLHVLQSTVMQSAAAYLNGVAQNCANGNRKLYWWWSVAWNLGPLLISSAWSAWHYPHSSNHLHCLRFRHKQTNRLTQMYRNIKALTHGYSHFAKKFSEIRFNIFLSRTQVIASIKFTRQHSVPYTMPCCYILCPPRHLDLYFQQQYTSIGHKHLHTFLDHGQNQLLFWVNTDRQRSSAICAAGTQRYGVPYLTDGDTFRWKEFGAQGNNMWFIVLFRNVITTWHNSLAFVSFSVSERKKTRAIFSFTWRPGMSSGQFLLWRRTGAFLKTKTAVDTFTHTHTYRYLPTYIHIHTRIPVPTYIHTHTGTCTYTGTYIHTYRYIHTHTGTYIHTHTGTYIHTHTYQYLHAYAYTYRYLHTYIHIPVPTHIQVRVCMYVGTCMCM